MENYTSTPDLPPLPSYTLKPQPSLIPGIPDIYVSILSPVVAYWIWSGIFHIIDEWDLFPQYRLHTPEELLKRNHASRWDVLRDVLIQQVIETVFGLVLAIIEPDPVYGKEQYNVAVWSRRIRIAQRAIPQVLGIVGINAAGLASKVAASHPDLASALSGGTYSHLMHTILVDGHPAAVAEHAAWEVLLAKAIYWVGIPALQFFFGILFVDTWQYFLHRAMHMNKWLYVKFHSRHHRLYVPYAYGALYNHPVEGFVLDTLGTGLAYLVTGMSVRQSIWFFAGSAIKTVDDHCGYALPFDPLQLITTNNAPYHDIHHQSWGIKTNFSQPFFTFWDKFLNTQWTGDVSIRYERNRVAAHKAVERDNATPEANKTSSVESSGASTPISVRRSTRKKASSISQQTESLKGLRDRMNHNLQGTRGNVLGLESGH